MVVEMTMLVTVKDGTILPEEAKELMERAILNAFVTGTMDDTGITKVSQLTVTNVTSDPTE